MDFGNRCVGFNAESSGGYDYIVRLCDSHMTTPLENIRSQAGSNQLFLDLKFALRKWVLRVWGWAVRYLAFTSNADEMCELGAKSFGTIYCST